MIISEKNRFYLLFDNQRSRSERGWDWRRWFLPSSASPSTLCRQSFGDTSSAMSFCSSMDCSLILCLQSKESEACVR